MLKCALGFNKVRSLTPNCLLGSLVHGQQPLDVSYYPVPKLRTRTGLSGCQSYGYGLVIKLVGSWGVVAAAAAQACACAGLSTLLCLRVASCVRYWRPLLLIFGTSWSNLTPYLL